MIAKFKLAPFSLAVILLLTASTFAQTILWDFETPGAPPEGWTPGWNAEDDTRCSPEEEYFCDMQQLPWKAEDGVLIPPSYPQVDGGIMDSFVLSPVFMSVPSPVIAQASGAGGPILSFSLGYDESKLNNTAGRDKDVLQVLLLSEGSAEFSQLVNLPLNRPDDWRTLDSMDNGNDGIIDHVIMVEEPIEAGVEYRLRVRAVDSDFDITTFTGVLGIDNVAVTNGVIAGAVNADADGDGDVDGADFLAWQRGFGIIAGAGLADGDFNFNGSVDGDDLNVWRTQYSSLSVAGAATVPEPWSQLSLFLGCAILAANRLVRP